MLLIQGTPEVVANRADDCRETGPRAGQVVRLTADLLSASALNAVAQALTRVENVRLWLDVARPGLIVRAMPVASQSVMKLRPPAAQCDH